MNRIATVTVILMLAAAPLAAQSLDIGVGGTGISIGNSRTWTGLRINWRDDDVRRVTGVNLTFWRPGDVAEFGMNGIALGVVGPGVGTLNGIGIGLGGVVAERGIRGIAVAGLGVVAQGRLDGVAAAGLGVVTERALRGAAVAGLGVVAQGGLSGLSAAGLGVVSEGPLAGIQIAGLGLVGQSAIAGISIAGLGTVTNGSARGITIGGLAVVAEEEAVGATIGGLAVVADGVRGVNIGGLAVVSHAPIAGLSASLGSIESSTAIGGVSVAGYRVKARRVEGLAAAIVMTRSDDLRGLGIAGYNDVRGTQTGITIGIYNSAGVLNGVQLGLLNRAQNNRPPFRWLPLVNAHFD